MMDIFKLDLFGEGGFVIINGNFNSLILKILVFLINFLGVIVFVKFNVLGIIDKVFVVLEMVIILGDFGVNGFYVFFIKLEIVCNLLFILLVFNVDVIDSVGKMVRC